MTAKLQVLFVAAVEEGARQFVAGAALPGAGAPVIDRAGGRGPGGQRDHEVIGRARPRTARTCARNSASRRSKARGRRGEAPAAKDLPCGGEFTRAGRRSASVPGRRVENLRDVHHGVARHGEGELRLPDARTFRRRPQPPTAAASSTVVSAPSHDSLLCCAAEVAQHGVGDVAFEQRRPPSAPSPRKKRVKSVQRRRRRPKRWNISIDARRRAGARVQQGDVAFAPRKGLVDHGQVADHQGEEAETRGRFDDHQRVGRGGARGATSPMPRVVKLVPLR